MDAQEISSKDLREKQADVLNQIAFKGAHYIITRHGKEAAALISLDEFYLLQETLEYLEDEQDLSDAKKAMKEVKSRGAKPLKQLAKELGINV
ncbi:type II toxin-antitoxin system Phd/YefM family antitoxin [Chlamydiales bacterium]|nr:type II toxin-antitoxin system Phd/YefM family antitoxin [Chlamydiales bacterium]